MTRVTLTRYGDVLDAFRNRDLRQALYDEGAVVTADTLLTLYGEAHTRRRKLENRLFRRDVFRHYEREVLPAFIAEASAPDLARGGCDLVDFGYRVTMNLTADFAGIDRARSRDEAHETSATEGRDAAAETRRLLALVRTFSEGATLVHSARDKEEVRAEVHAALDTLDAAFLQPSIARRQEALARFRAGERKEEELPQDVLTVLLRNEDELHLPHEVVRREIAFYLQAGSHSSANAITHALHEIFRWCGEAPERWARVERDRLFVQRCVHESLRLHPASPESWRRPVAPLVLETRVAGGRHALGPDDLIVMDMMAANRDAEVFGATAAAFDPERPLPSQVLPFGLSFGRGAHACIGQDLDAGQIAREDTDPDDHLYGVVPAIVQQLLDWGARPDPEDPATADAKTQRANWGRYPVRFTKLAHEDSTRDGRSR